MRRDSERTAVHPLRSPPGRRGSRGVAKRRDASSSLTGDAIWSNEQLACVVDVEVSGSFRIRLLSAGDVPTPTEAEAREQLPRVASGRLWCALAGCDRDVPESLRGVSRCRRWGEQLETAPRDLSRRGGWRVIATRDSFNLRPSHDSVNSGSTWCGSTWCRSKSDRFFYGDSARIEGYSLRAGRRATQLDQ